MISMINNDNADDDHDNDIKDDNHDNDVKRW